MDSQSPTDEHAVFQRVAPTIGLRAVYARTHERETIQKAWNRGILLARAPYLSFLGVDEMVRPQALATLAAELDADPSLDWVQGNSLMTEVDVHGTPQRDLMIYQRIPYEQDLVYLETCYLSWVGGMYRRTMHERLGYYDESFGAAGDTEFKNRVLPYIKSKTLPMTLGVFLNYPEERATQSPRAEIEDLRAWYLHRSAAGVEYALAKRPAGDALHLFKMAMSYRKSYRDHVSSDLDYASELATYAARRSPQPDVQLCAAAVERALRAYRELDWLPALSPRSFVRERSRVEQLAAGEARRVQAALGGGGSVVWAIFNDNRYEQHTNPWEAKALAAKHVFGERCLWARTTQPAVVPETAERVGSASGEAVEAGVAAERLIAAIRAEGALFSEQGQNEMARDFGVIAQYLQNLAEGKPSPVGEANEPGAVLCTVLWESLQGAPYSQTGRFDQKFAELCARQAELAAPFCAELSDAFEGFAVHALQKLEETRCVATTARLLTYKSPGEAVKRHSADLTGKVLETLQRAAASAQAGGNAAYAQRLNSMAAAVRLELAAIEGRKFLRPAS